MRLLKHFILQQKSGGSIHIKKKNEGKFTDYCNGKVTNSCIQRAKKSGNKKLIKRAVFAENARKWKHQEGGVLGYVKDGLNAVSKGIGVGLQLLLQNDLIKTQQALASDLITNSSSLTAQINDAIRNGASPEEINALKLKLMLLLSKAISINSQLNKKSKTNFFETLQNGFNGLSNVVSQLPIKVTTDDREAAKPMSKNEILTLKANAMGLDEQGNLKLGWIMGPNGSPIYTLGAVGDPNAEPPEFEDY